MIDHQYLTIQLMLVLFCEIANIRYPKWFGTFSGTFRQWTTRVPM